MRTCLLTIQAKLNDIQMKESKLIEMQRQLEIAGQALNRLLQEVDMLKTMVMGDHQVIKQLKEFPDIIKKMQDEQENANGTTAGDSGATDSNLELE